MIDALSPRGQSALRKVLIQRPLLAFDLDGTLIELIKDPRTIHIPLKIRTLLKALNREIPVAIISGRGRKNLKQAFPNREVSVLVGNHGVEGIQLSAQQLKSFRSICKMWTKALGCLPADIYLENKEFSLSVHYRNSKSRSRARKEILKLIAGLKPRPKVVTGKLLFNLLPPSAPHKGIALLKTMQRLRKRAAIFLGDDETDENVFRMKKTSVMGIRIGNRNKSSAGFKIRSQSEIENFLKICLRSLTADAE